MFGTQYIFGLSGPNPTRNLIRFFWVAAILALIACIVAFLLKVDPLWILVIGGALLITAIVVIVFFAWQLQVQLRDIAAIQAGQYWAHWKYSDDDMRKFRDNEATKTEADLSLYTKFTIGLAVVGGIIGLILGKSVVFGLIGFGVMAFAGSGVLLRTYLESRTLSYPNPDEPNHEVYLTRLGIYQPGTPGRYQSLVGFNLNLRNVKLDSSGTIPVIQFDSVSVGYRRDALVGHKTSQTTSVRLGVPKASEAEAQAVIERFQKGTG